MSRKQSSAIELILFYDGGCPLCVKEMRHLRARDKKLHGDQYKIQLEDIFAADFSERFPHIDRDKANQVLHAQYPNGEIILGLDVTHQAWRRLGRGWTTAFLRWPVIRWFADKFYLWFARNRNQLSKLITGQARCQECRID